MSAKEIKHLSFRKPESRSGKENNIPVNQKGRAKKVPELNNSFRDLRSTANRKFSTLVNALDNLSERLRQSMRRQRVLTDSNYSVLNEATSAQATPVKLYSPFGIETPSPAVKKDPKVKRCFPPRRFEFSSPTGKLKKDVRNISEGLNELNAIVVNMESKIDNRNVP